MPVDDFIPLSRLLIQFFYLTFSLLGFFNNVLGQIKAYQNWAPREGDELESCGSQTP